MSPATSVRSRSSLLLLAFVSSSSTLAYAGQAEKSAAVDPTVAEQKAACASGFEQAQVLRQSAKLKASRVELLKCVQAVCSRPVQEQCSRWLGEIEPLTPSIVIAATVEGQDHSDVDVEMDGELVANALGGTAIDLDPGPHVITFRYQDYPPVEKNFVVREGEKLRKIKVSFKRPQALAPTPAPAPLPPPEPVVMHRPVPALAWALGGVALVGAGAFAYFGTSARSRRTELEQVCSPDCADSDVNSLHTRLIAADVSLGVGVAALLSAAIVYGVRPSVPVEQAKLTGSLRVTPHAIGASALLEF
ncbi:MAG TPA: hypothetical protein VGF76_26205 [Polyangiaceae bacterium]